MASQFPFVQFEFACSVGPAPGRYLVRPRNGAGPVEHAEQHDPGELFGTADVLVVRVVGAPRPRAGILRRSARYEGPGESPGEVPLTLCTVILGTRGLDSADAGRRMVASLKSSGDERERVIGDALRILNRAVGAHRVCAGDPYAVDVSRFDPLAVRVGYGDAERVFAGSWKEAISVALPPAPRVRREIRLIPVQEMAAVLAGRIPVFESEDLLLRVTLDADHGRPRAAALGLRAATELLEAELPTASGGEVPHELMGTRERIFALADRALAAEPFGDAEAEQLRSLVGEVNTVMDGRREGRLTSGSDQRG